MGNNPKVLVTAPFSRVGIRVVELARKRNLPLSAESKIAGKDRIADITNKDETLKVFAAEKPGVVVHVAAYTDVDGCEKDPEKAQSVNVAGTENVAEACRKTGARLINISTDYVFDGKAGPYSEADSPCPINVYGQTKLDAEKQAAEICPDSLTIRICVPYDWNDQAAPNFLMWLVEKLEAGQEVKIVTDQWSTPTCVPRLAEIILACAASKESGIVHVADRDFLNRYDFALKIAKVFGLDETLIKPATSNEFKQAAGRPLKGGLKTAKAEKFLGRKMISVEEGIRLAKEARG